MLTLATRPSGVWKLSSGDVDGAVTRRPFAVLDQPVEAELRGPLHDRPGALAQKRPVPAERVVLPEVRAEPRPAHRPVRPLRVAAAEVPDRGGLCPEVGVVVRHPAARSIVDLRRAPAVRRQRLDEGEERLVGLRQVRHLGRPVVHLGVDVERPVGAPRRAHRLVPDALQVGRRPAWPRAGDQQVAPVLVEQRREPGIGLTLREALQPRVGRKLRGARGRAEVERHAPEEPLVVRDVARREVCMAHRLGSSQLERASAPTRRVPAT